MVTVADPIMTAFVFLFLIWFILLIVAEIFYCARRRMEKGKKALYTGFLFSFIAAAALTIYTAYLAKNHDVIFILVSFVSNFILWAAPAVIAALIYWVYSWKNNQKPKQPKEQKRQVPPENLSFSLYGKQLQKESQKEFKTETQNESENESQNESN